jgi:alpha-N-acetylglucosaminidase
VQSKGKPVTALNAESGHPATAANDGSRSNNPYWGGPLTLGSTWWQVDLGAVNDVSRVNVRNYVDGTRYYTYRLEGSADGTHWFTLGGRDGPNPATDAGDTTTVEGQARYIRVVGLGNTANGTFHLTEVTVYGTPA